MPEPTDEPPREPAPPEVVEHFRRAQQIDAARGCLVAAVLEGAALLAGVLWLIAFFLDLPGLMLTGKLAFIVFTGAALVVGVLLLILGNTRRHRQLRRDAEGLSNPKSPKQP